MNKYYYNTYVRPTEEMQEHYAREVIKDLETIHTKLTGYIYDPANEKLDSVTRINKRCALDYVAFQVAQAITTIAEYYDIEVEYDFDKE